MEAAVSVLSHPTFGTLDDFLGYIDLHKESPRALTCCKHIIQLVFLASGTVDYFENPGGCYHDCCCFDSLHNYRTSDLLVRVRERISDGDIPDDWHKELAKIMSPAR